MVSGWATVPESIVAHYFDEQCCRGCAAFQSACGTYDLDSLDGVKPISEVGVPPCSRCVRRAEQRIGRQARKKPTEPQ